MATPLPMPKLGLTMEEGTILKWRKGEGETVEKGEIILDIQTDKVEYEVESPDGGLLLKTLAGEGDVVPCGTDIAVIGEAGEDISGFGSTPAKASAVEPNLRGRRRLRRHHPHRRLPPLRRLLWQRSLRPRAGFSPVLPPGAWPENSELTTAPSKAQAPAGESFRQT